MLLEATTSDGGRATRSQARCAGVASRSDGPTAGSATTARPDWLRPVVQFVAILPSALMDS